MNKILIAASAVMVAALQLSATNLDNIYGRNDLNYTMDRAGIYGSNFGTILDYNPGDPQFIDIQYAQTQIDKLRSEIEIFNEEVSRYESRIAEERNKKDEISDLITRIDLLLVELKSTSADLYYTKTNLSDKEMRIKIQVSIEENRQQMYDLDNKRAELNLQVNGLADSIEISGRFITLNNLFIRRNTKEISYLKSCIEYTSQDTSSVDALVNKSTSYQSEVDDILKVSY